MPPSCLSLSLSLSLFLSIFFGVGVIIVDDVGGCDSFVGVICGVGGGKGFVDGGGEATAVADAVTFYLSTEILLTTEIGEILRM